MTVAPTDVSEFDLGASLFYAAESFAERYALSAGGERLTYRQLFEQAGAIASALESAGINAGDGVAVLGERSASTYAGVIAVLLAGCIYIPLNPKFPTARNASILSRSGARALIIDDETAQRQASGFEDLDDLLVITPESDTVALGHAFRRLHRSVIPPVDLDDIEPRWSPGPQSPAYLLFTSGTTGEPKGVPITHNNVASYLRAILPHIPIGPDDRVLQAVDLTFDLSVHDMMVTWLNGAELYAAPDNGAIIAPRIIAANHITACLLVPSAGARAIDYGIATPGKMPSLRYSLFAGEALPVELARSWQAAAPNAAIFNLYGPTEGTIHTSLYRFDALNPSKTSIVPIGLALGDQQMVLSTPDGSPPDDGEAAEIWLTGPQMTPGYWQAPHLDGERFVLRDGVRWYRTGDLGRLDPIHGMLYCGRSDRQMKIRGYRVELQEVEGVLRSVTGRNQVAIAGWPVVNAGAADGLVAFLTGAVTDGEPIKARMREALPAYMIPDRIEFLETLPLNSNGKTDYAALSRFLDEEAWGDGPGEATSEGVDPDPSTSIQETSQSGT